MDGIRELGNTFMSAFQKLPGFSELINNTSTYSTVQLVCGILTVLAFVLGIACVIFGIVKYAMKKLENERNGSNEKKPISFLVGGLISGGVLILLPSLVLAIGAIFGQIATA